MTTKTKEVMNMAKNTGSNRKSPSMRVHRVPVSRSGSKTASDSRIRKTVKESTTPLMPTRKG
jgi:hypothetical protein